MLELENFFNVYELNYLWTLLQHRKLHEPLKIYYHRKTNGAHEIRHEFFVIITKKFNALRMIASKYKGLCEMCHVLWRKISKIWKVFIVCVPIEPNWFLRRNILLKSWHASLQSKNVFNHTLKYGAVVGKNEIFVQFCYLIWCLVWAYWKIISVW